ncbi:Aste57867_15472 [Aphanomyces stellatus]|uniref:Aste57867_15472 protein n=1 Tax=Aphanomyces stellatus TaxID=120398 RepID=A0A485L649_9STRA|nr:hypothetical protein As57867_015416 [Aphanomyces stellatus]VFT92274.1 Aste57867_15472 [Aphanomyces stellatus]
MLGRRITRNIAVPATARYFATHSSASVKSIIRGSVPKSEGPFDVKRITAEWSSAIAARDIAVNELIGSARGTIYPTPTRFTIQMAHDKHVEVFGGLEYANHSCNPNASFVMSESDPIVKLVAIKPITKGQDITFDYNTTEWDMDEKFNCQCGDAACRGHVHGAKHLNNADVLKLLPHFSASNLRRLLKDKLVKG